MIMLVISGLIVNAVAWCLALQDKPGWQAILAAGCNAFFTAALIGALAPTPRR